MNKKKIQLGWQIKDEILNTISIRRLAVQENRQKAEDHRSKK
jgi:hypothetical protein